jgi:hypothetical protein
VRGRKRWEGGWCRGFFFGGGEGFGGDFFSTLELGRKKGKSIKFSNEFIYLELVN